MFQRLLSLQWKSFFRSSSLGKSLGIKIVMGFFAVYMMLFLVGMGGALYFILEKAVPDENPIWVLSKYLIYWVLIELLLRYFLQKLPVMDIKPFLLTPIKKSAIAHYILGRSSISIYNFLAFFFFLPFAIVLLIQGYAWLNVLCWFLSILAIILAINYVNFIVNKSDKALLVIGGLLVVIYGLNYFQIVDIEAIFAPIFHGLYQYPAAVLVPIGLALLAYWVNYRFLKTKIFLDASLKSKTKEAKTSDLAWTKRFGEMAPFLQLDLKLIWRNKRTKMQVFISLLMVFYGLIFYSNEIYADWMVMFVFVGIFITGIFLTNFGQFIPAWDSAYYGMMMSQNIPLRKYLESKALLISVSVGVMFLISIPYVYFGWKALAINFACALYNLGINIPVILYFGSWNKKRIDLDKSAFGNMQGTSSTQFLIMLPILGAPILIFSILYYVISFEAAVVALSVMGVVGFALRNQLLDRITEQYRIKKYGMIAGFKEQNS